MALEVSWSAGGTLSFVVLENLHGVKMDGFPGASATLMVQAGQTVLPCTISPEPSCWRLTEYVQQASEAWAWPSLHNTDGTALVGRASGLLSKLSIVTKPWSSDRGLADCWIKYWVVYPIPGTHMVEGEH